MKRLLVLFLLSLACFAEQAPPPVDEAPFAMVYGGVRKTGRFTISPNETVLSILKRAGGYSEIWNGKGTVSRREDGAISVIHAFRCHIRSASKERDEYLAGIPVRDGDIVYFSSAIP